MKLALPELFLDHGYCTLSCVIYLLFSLFSSFIWWILVQCAFKLIIFQTLSILVQCSFISLFMHLAQTIHISSLNEEEEEKKQSIKRCIRNSKAARRIASPCFFSMLLLHRVDEPDGPTKKTHMASKCAVCVCVFDVDVEKWTLKHRDIIVLS